MEMKENNEPIKIIEVLPEEKYKEGHVPGAINIPLDKLEEGVKGLDKKETLVVYCSSYKCQASTKAAKKLLELGFTNVLDFKAGKKSWTDAQLKLEQ